MSDLIDRAELLTNLNACISESDGQTPIVDAVLTAIKGAVEQMPSIDAAPHMYIMYSDGVPVRYAFGEPWIEQALLMDDIGYGTEEEAIAAWSRRAK